jgi:ATP-dependent Clp protease ATP-binding subunit ClpC
MFERYTERARKIMNYASRKALAMDQDKFGTEHILLGLVRVVEGTGAKELELHNITPKQVRTTLAELVEVPSPVKSDDELHPTPEAKNVIKFSVQEARELKHNYVGTEHVLLGLLHETNGVAYKALTKLGLKIDDVRNDVR